MPKLAVLVSGAGSILKAILEYPLEVDMVIADRECLALDIASKARISMHLVDRSCFQPLDESTRQEFSIEIMEILRHYQKDDVAAMAGFRTILSPIFFSWYAGKLLNTHPSLLPAFKGHHAVRRALNAGASKTGCTVHIATEKLDDGQILAQEEVPILPGDTEEIAHERIKVVERALYPKTIEKVLMGLL
jgi:phosphoribosylglycinamide formyltransferase-1